ncbi:MAG TPA: FG-GAP-like repeat-containing protein [Verrucomicrobiota bacterium]|nr:FG-GAP-like repeat-containing protein [Verrucomicrobiota bacterium]
MTGILSVTLSSFLALPCSAMITIEVEKDLDAEIVGKATRAYMPYVMTKGDFNGDGTPDLALGSCFENYDMGLVSVFFGGDSFEGLPKPPEVVQVGVLNGIPPVPANENVALVGSVDEQSVGTLLAAGDLDGDGFDDLVVVAQDENPANSKPEQAKVGIFFGGPSFKGLLDFNAEVDVLLSRDYAHYTAVAVGDIDKDGFDDLIIADDLSNNINDPPMNSKRDIDGAVYLIYGRARSAWPAAVDLKSKSDARFVRNEGNTAFQVKSLAVGDVDGDGTADLAMGAPWEDAPGRADAGKVFLRRGGTRLEGSLDIDATASSVITGAMKDDKTGGELVTNVNGNPLAIGDVNGDGIGDLIIGSPSSMLGVPNSTGVGKVEVFFGRTPFPATVDLAAAVNVRLILGGNPRLFYTGKSVSADDINGDGIGDISISSHAWQASTVNPRADGVVHTVFGASALSTTYSLLTQADLSLEAPPPTDRLSGSKMGSCFVIGQFNKNNIPDVVLGGTYGGLNSRGWAAVVNDVITPGVIEITDVKRVESGTRLEWTGMSGWLFTVQYRPNLMTSPTWRNLLGATDLPGTNAPMTTIDTTPITDTRFYRIVARKP